MSAELRIYTYNEFLEAGNSCACVIEGLLMFDLIFPFPSSF